MKYNEKNVTELFKKENAIWNADDLDWFDNQLVYKLQHNELPKQEKNMLIEMMANDQAVMNRYLQLKQETMPLKESILDKIFMALKTRKMIPLMAVGLVMIVSMVVVIKQKNDYINYEPEPVRGISEITIYPAENSLINQAPGYFLINNKQSQKLRIQINFENRIVWLSQSQQSNKFYIPVHIQQQLIPGQYSWAVIDKNNIIIVKNNFTIN